jgi:hypothetical protein
MEIQNTYIQSNTWDFYGRNEELENVKSILSRGRWFFLKITGRRRIGKTTLNKQTKLWRRSKDILWN